SRSVTMSTATIGYAPASTAPITTDRPTPPAPKTATLWPAQAPIALSTVPTPVMTAQPVMAATAAGTPGGMGTTARSETIADSAKQGTPTQGGPVVAGGRAGGG